MSDLKEKIIEVLRDVYDPEIPVNVYDLGLIYEINIKEDKSVHILMTLTSPTCPTAEYIQTMIEDAIKTISEIKDVEIELTFTPAWTPDRVSMDAKEELGLGDVQSQDNLAVQSVYGNDSICSKCNTSSDKKILLKAFHNNKEILICNDCLVKSS